MGFMAWIRRVRTTSGATAVQIVESVDGRRRIVRHVGSAHTELELGFLIEQAHQLLVDDRQGELDLGFALPRLHARLLPPATQPVLVTDRGRRGRPVVSPPRVLRSASGLLFDTIVGVYTDLGFDQIGDEVFRDLVVARIVEPTSLLDVDRVLAEVGRVSASLSTRKRTLQRCQDGRYRDKLAELCFKHAVTRGDVSLILYDVTTLYFEADNEDDLRRVGYSKERRVDPQIVVGLLVDRQGFPLEIGCFEGNKAEKHTLIPIIEQFRNRYGLVDLIVVGDAGMLSMANLKALDEAGYRFIVGSRLTKAPLDLESHFRWCGDQFTDGQLIDTITSKIGRTKDNDPGEPTEPVWDPERHPRSWRAVWSYSAKRAARDMKTLILQENRAQAVIDGAKQARKPRFVKPVKTGFILDQTSLDRAKRLTGLKGYVTNIPAIVIPPEQIISSYHDLWQVEQSFRMSKTDLAARPLFARRRDAIEAHLTIVFAALAISRTMQNRSGLAIRRIIRTLKPLRSATININGVTHNIPPAIDQDTQTLLDTLTLRH
jgi:transposase